MSECEGITLLYGIGRSLKVILAYRPPRPPGSDADFEFSDKLCTSLSNITAPAVILGDLHFAGASNSEAEKRVLEAVQNHFWSQHVDFPTRRDPSSGNESLLDRCQCSNPKLINGVESPGWFSDHAICSVDLVIPSFKDSFIELVPN